MTVPILLTVNEAARLLHVSPARLYSLVRLGAMPCVRIGRQVRINPQTLENFVATGGRALEQRIAAE